MGYTALRFEIHGGVATITLNRPSSANAVDLTLAQELYGAALSCESDSSIRTVIITAEGTMFCGGGNLKDFAARGDDLPRHLTEVTAFLHGAIEHFTSMSPPVIAAVQGMAAGAGMSLACACDIVLAARSARFTMAYTALGLSPDGGGTFTLPRLVGHGRALELMLTNRVLSAEEACRLGIVTQVTDDEALLPEAASLAQRFVSGPTAAYGATKRLMLASTHGTLESQLRLEQASIAALAAAPNGREGIQAFSERRAPRFG
ncbi:enoyl-CoA hydratase [bacterium]|nr:MAG: enoyl-CoA hydratase [bacterium]